MELSENQKLALLPNNGKNMLVSAGAGSGKTTVLTERVYRLITSGARIDRFLILTFTNLAAASMKNKIRKALLSDSRYSSLSSEVDLAHIETFDAFCLFLVKKYSYKLGINNDVSIADGSILSIKKKEILESIFDDLYKNHNEVFTSFILKNCVKDDSHIVDFILRISDLAESQVNKYDYLNNYIDNYYTEDKIDSFINEGYNDYVKNLLLIKSGAENLEDAEDAYAISNFIDILLENKTYDSLIESIRNPSTSFPSKKKGVITSDGDYRKTLSGAYSALKKKYYGSSEEIKRLFFSDKETVTLLIQITYELERKLDSFMKEYNIYDFSSIAKMTTRLLNDEEVLKKTKESFDYIFVDEYQDTNDIQEDVILKLQRNNLYMVGDIKQSIYRFRNANCQIFQDKYDEYKKGINGIKIDLNESFRSRKEIVDSVNEIFTKIMTKNNNPIDYSSGHAFIYGNKNYHKNVEQGEDYSLKVLNYVKPKGPLANEIEARIIADDIASKFNKKVLVYDEEENKMRPCSFKDFAIIIDRSTNFATYKRIFADYNIPLKVVGAESLVSSDVAYVLKNLFKIVLKASNGQYDKEYEHCYFSIARSFLISIDDDELLDIHHNKTYLVTPLGQKIELLKGKLRYSSLSKIFMTFIEEFDIYNKLIDLGKFSANSHKIETLYELSKTMDSLGFDLPQFVKYFEDLASYDLDIDFVDNDIVENSVTLITIHKSKGLEYKICYFPGLNKKFNTGSTTSFITSKDYGLLLPYTENNAPSSLLNHLYKEKERKDNIEEKLRLFYVALTRAQERIILLNPIDPLHERKTIYSLDKINSFYALINYCNLDIKYGVNVELKNIHLNYQSKVLNLDSAIRKDIHIESLPIESKHASKVSEEKIDYKKLEFGTRLHAYLEITDFVSKDTSFITDPSIKKYVDNVVNNPLFSNLEESKILHEYHFYDDINSVNGIIDLLIVKNSEVLIVDFKLKNIEDAAYKNQLKIYKKFVSTITDKPIRMYLISAINGKEEEIYD